MALNYRLENVWGFIDSLSASGNFDLFLGAVWVILMAFAIWVIAVTIEEAD